MSTLLEHCLGLKREHQDEPTKLDNDVTSLTCPLLRYLATCDSPSSTHVSHLCSQYGCDVTTGSGQGPLHVYLTSHVTSVSLSLVSQLVEAGVHLDQRDEDGNTPLLCLSHLLDRGQIAVAAQIAQFLCTQPGCDVNSGNKIVQYNICPVFSCIRSTNEWKYLLQKCKFSYFFVRLFPFYDSSQLHT